ncbi:MAG: radical SAM protein [Deltaproteobacteria bacterium]|nr:radical SAM protein [Deltaproteobacteria bacterium]
MPSVVLISTYELGHQPMGLALPAAFLAREGVEARCLDLAVEDLDEAAIAQARFVGISVPMHTALRLACGVARRVRAINGSCTLCFFGLYAPLNRELLIANGASLVLGGEYDEELARAARSALAEIELPSVAPPPILRKLRFPVARRDGLPPLDRYAKLLTGGEERVAGYTEASRGCLRWCLHCPVPAVYSGRFFVVPVDTVLEDVAAQVAMGARHITFGDADFLNGPGHSLAVVRRMRERFPGVSFDFTAKVEHLLRHRAVLPEMARSGCAFVVTALESLSDEVLGQLEKGHTRADALELFDITRDLGLTLRPSFIPFTPWSTLDDYLDLVDLIAARDLVCAVDAVQLTIRLLLPPGSLLLPRVKGAPWLGELDPAALAYRWRHPDPRMDLLHRHVESIARRAAAAGEDPAATFDHIRSAARSVVGLGPAPSTSLRSTHFQPRLSEPWFC